MAPFESIWTRNAPKPDLIIARFAARAARRGRDRPAPRRRAHADRDQAPRPSPAACTASTAASSPSAHHALTKEGRWMAAVLACGEGAVLSHESAAELWWISPTSPMWVHVTVPGNGGRRQRKGIVLHRSTTLTPADVTRRKGIPVTTHARTMRDLGFGPEPTRSDLERAFLSHLPPSPHPHAAGERPGRALHRRFPLASRATHRRSGRLGLSPQPRFLRVRPRPRPRALPARFRGAALRRSGAAGIPARSLAPCSAGSSKRRCRAGAPGGSGR